MTTKYERTIGYANICSRVWDHIIKFQMWNQFLVMKEQGYEHILKHLIQVKSWRTISNSEYVKTLKKLSVWRLLDNIISFWLILLYSNGRSLWDSGSMDFLLLIAWINKEINSRIKGMKHIIPIEIKEFQTTFQRH